MSDKQNQPANLAASVFERYGTQLHRYLLRHLRQAQDAQDLAQEVYLRLLRLERGELVRQPNAYLFFVASQVVSQFKMHSKAEPITYDSDIAEQRTEHPAHFREDLIGDDLHARNQLEQLLRKLPRSHRNVLLMRKRDGLSWTQIAEKLDLSVHTVKKYLHEARARIRVMDWEGE